MSIKVYPYIADISKAKTIQTSQFEKPVTDVSFQETLDAAAGKEDRTDNTVTGAVLQAKRSMAVDFLISKSPTGSVSVDTVQKLLGFNPAPDGIGLNAVTRAKIATSTTEAAEKSEEAPAETKRPSSPEYLDDYFKKASETYGVDVNLLKAIAKAESNFDIRSTSGSGAMGIMQLMPATAAELGISDAYDAHDNILGGAQVIARHIEKYGGNLELALAAYNAGPNNVDKYGGIPPFEETQTYVKRVLSFYREFSS